MLFRSTAIRALIGSLRHGELLAAAPPALAQKLAQMDQTSARMGVLVDDLLLLTRFDRAIDDRPSLETFPLGEMVEDLLDLHQAQAEAAGVRLQAQIEAPGVVRGNPERLRRLLENLLSNALRFSPRGGHSARRVAPTEGMDAAVGGGSGAWNSDRAARPRV